MRFQIAALTVAFAALLTGPAVPAADPIPLRAGPVTLMFDADLAFVRYVRVGKHEVLRGINAPIRNDIWGTIIPEVSNLQVEKGDDHFSVTFDAVCQEPGLDFRWKGTLTGTKEGDVTWTFDGTAHSTFKKNRIGFCILHGPSAAGQPWEIEHADGQTKPGRFPALISPHQPAKNIRAITHEVAPGIRARVHMEGDIWEMEDQRNWTDASFKTYCTPLAIPYPVELAEGTKIVQKVCLSVEGSLPTGTETSDVITLSPKHSKSDADAIKLPRIGMQVSSESDSLSDAAINRLERLGLNHLRVDLDPADDVFRNRLDAAAHQARQLQVALHVGLHLTEDTELQAALLSESLRLCPTDISTVLCLGATAEQYEQVRKAVHSVRPTALVARGYDTNFVDLNRDRPQPGSVDAVTWAINPQIHAFDKASIVESLPIHTMTLETARAFCRPVAGDPSDVPPMLIGPITLRSPHMGRPPLPGQLPPDVDARQTSLFAAAWTASCLHQLARGSAHSVTLYETVGWKGVMDLDDPPDRPDAFPTAAGGVYGIYHVLREVADFRNGRVVPVASSDLLSADALWLTDDQQTRVIVANFTDDTLRIQLNDHGAGRLRLLHAAALKGNRTDPEKWHAQPGHNFSAERPFNMPAHAIAVIDSGSN